jgi:hypothetical protein
MAAPNQQTRTGPLGDVRNSLVSPTDDPNVPASTLEKQRERLLEEDVAQGPAGFYFHLREVVIHRALALRDEQHCVLMSSSLFPQTTRKLSLK